MPNIVIHLAADIILAVLILQFLEKTKSEKRFLAVTGILFASNLIDLDHLIANPIYDAARCSINFHPLHSFFMFPIYLAGLYFPKTRILSLGIILHLTLDAINCLIIGKAIF